MSTDILISFDTTGSMAGCIGLVRQRVEETIGRILSTIPDCRMALIAHGDYCDRPEVAMQFLDFTSNPEALVRFVRTAKNTDGGDSDEFYEKILHDAQSFDWQADNCIFMVIGDAKPHGPRYNYGKAVTESYVWELEADKLADKHIHIYSVQALDRQESDHFYKEIANRTNGKHVRLQQFNDSVETILAICYHNAGTLNDYRSELELNFKMNRNLANLFTDLDAEIGAHVSTHFVRKDSSGLIPVHPSRFQVIPVAYDREGIKDAVERAGLRFKIGRGFYQLSKSELVQERKEVILENKLTGDMFTGSEAREFIGLPFGTRGKVSPRYSEVYRVFVQSTSPNRKLVAGTVLLYEDLEY